MTEAFIGGAVAIICAVIALVGQRIDAKSAARSEEQKRSNTAEHEANKALLHVILTGQTRIESKVDDHIEWHAEQPSAPPLVVVAAGGK